MSCSSPFVYNVFSATVSTTQSVGVSGSYKLPGYTTPSTELCLLGYNDGCSWEDKCSGGADCGKWSCKWNSCEYKTSELVCKGAYWYWYDCSAVPGIPLWPTITFSAGCTIPMVFAATDGFQITVEAPEGEPYEATSITLNACKLTLGINGTDVTINIIPDPIAVEQVNGDFDINIELDSFSSDYDYAGITYTLTITNALLFCLTPTPPSGWINLTMSCTLVAKGDGIDYSTSFTIECPIVSVEDTGA